MKITIISFFGLELIYFLQILELGSDPKFRNRDPDPSNNSRSTDIDKRSLLQAQMRRTMQTARAKVDNFVTSENVYGT